MPSSDFSKLGAQLLPVLQAAGRAEMEVFQSAFQVDVKSDQSPVTEADRRAEKIILEALATISPDIPVVAEEAASEGHIPQVGERFFLVDPLDGTKEFVKKSDEFTINIGLIEGGAPVFGVIYAPATRRLFLTTKRDEAVTARLPLEQDGLTLGDIEPVAIGASAPPADGYRVLASLSHMTEDTRDYIDRFRVKEMVSAGSSLKFCLLAMGEADFYPRFSPTCEWDTAAGHAILKAVGGEVFDRDGGVLAYGKQDRVFVNPPFIACARDELPTS